MLIAALAVDDRAEEPFPDHAHDHHFVPVVAAVFEHHAVDAGALVGLDEGPAVLEGIRAAHLRADLLAAVHGVNGRGDVVFPGGEDADHVHVVPLDEGAVVRRGGHVPVFLFLAVGHGLGAAVLVCVADGGDDGVVPFGENAVNMAHAAAAQSDHAYSEFSHWINTSLVLSDYVSRDLGPIRNLLYPSAGGMSSPVGKSCPFPSETRDGRKRGRKMAGSVFTNPFFCGIMEQIAAGRRRRMRSAVR